MMDETLRSRLGSFAQKKAWTLIERIFSMILFTHDSVIQPHLIVVQIPRAPTSGSSGR